MTKETRQIPTIGQAAISAGVSKEAFQKRIQRALKDDKLSDIRQKLRIESYTPTGLRDTFAPELSALLSASGFDVPTGNGQEKTPYLASGGIATGFSGIADGEKVGGEFVVPVDFLNKAREWSPNNLSHVVQPPKPDKPVRVRRKKPVIVPLEIPTPEPEPDTKPDTTISDRFFQSEIIVLSALLVLIFSDGFSMSLLAGRTFGGSGLAYVLFSVVGLIIGYSAISTTRAAYQARIHRWQTDFASVWIFVFAVFQTALHGSAFDLFGDWSDLVGRVLIVLSIPLATASLTTTILKPSK